MLPITDLLCYRRHTPLTEIVVRKKSVEVVSRNRLLSVRIWADMNGKSVSAEKLMGVTSNDRNMLSAVVLNDVKNGRVLVVWTRPSVGVLYRMRALIALPVTRNVMAMGLLGAGVVWFVG